MAEITNIRGVFKLSLGGTEREIKATFDAIEKLENDLFKRPVVSVLQSAIAGSVSFRDVVSLIQAGLEAKNDTRLSRKEIGEFILDDGLAAFIPVFIEYLTYCLTGGKEQKKGKADEA